MSVIDERHCQADDVSRCKGPWPTLTVGSDPNADPSAVAIDQQTDTLYVADANDNTVAVFNGATCNAETSAGCGQTPAMVPVGMVPVAIFDDPVDHTVYIPNGGEDDVSMLDSATCNASDLATCPTTAPPTVTVAWNRDRGDVDQATHTAYVTICANPSSDARPEPRACRCSTRAPATRPRSRAAGGSACSTRRSGPIGAKVDPAQPDSVHGQQRQHDLSV